MKKEESFEEEMAETAKIAVGLTKEQYLGGKFNIAVMNAANRTIGHQIQLMRLDHMMARDSASFVLRIGRMMFEDPKERGKYIKKMLPNIGGKLLPRPQDKKKKKR